MANRLIALSVAGVLAGCTLIDPHVDVERPTMVLPVAGTDATAILYEGGALPTAMRRADQLRQRYFEAVSEQSRLRNGLSLGLIGLSAVALYVGITSSGSSTQDFLAAAGLGGAAAIGAGTLLLPPGRQRVYLEGSTAVGCAILAMRPALVTEVDYKNLREGVVALADAIGRLDAFLTTTDFDAARKAAALTQGREVQSAARRFLAAVDSAGLFLDQSVQTIRDKVSEQLLRTEPDLGAVLAVASGLRATGMRVIGGLPSPLSPPKVGDAQALFLGGAPLSLDQAIGNVMRASAGLVDIVARASELERGIEAVSACRPTAAAAPQLTLPSETVDIVAGQTIDVPVLGGTIIPRVAVQGPVGVSAAAVLVDVMVVVRITAAKDAAAGERRLLLIDSTGKLLVNARIAVAAATKPAAPSATPSPTTPPPAAAPPAAPPPVSLTPPVAAPPVPAQTTSGSSTR